MRGDYGLLGGYIFLLANDCTNVVYVLHRQHGKYIMGHVWDKTRHGAGASFKPPVRQISYWHVVWSASWRKLPFSVNQYSIRILLSRRRPILGPSIKRGFGGVTPGKFLKKRTCDLVHYIASVV